jgi:hypothetical protein
MSPFSKLIESSDWIFGQWVLLSTVVKGTWAVASVGNMTVGSINAVIGFVIPLVNLIFAILLEANIGIPLFSHAESIVGALTVGSLEEWFSVDKTLGLVIGEIVGAGTKTASILTNIHEMGSSVTMDIGVSALVAFNIFVTQSSLGAGTECCLFN